MAALSDYLATRLASFLFKNNAMSYAPPGDSLYLAVFTSGLGLNEGSLTNEVSGAGYARVQTPASIWDQDGGEVENNAPIDFVAATAAWGSITHGAIIDTATLEEGEILMHGEFAVPRNVGSGDQLRFLPGEAVFGFE